MRIAAESDLSGDQYVGGQKKGYGYNRGQWRLHFELVWQIADGQLEPLSDLMLKF